ncbi:hypothetical protein [Aliikangiella sp. IMCC44359]|uniref:hypothetical protein n=1 Tax=Aliikangiella sp. IMCC44359 TaxID=3459125 RepID=UPI00403AAAFF
MSLLRRWFGDDHNLKAVNLETAPRFTIDLSGSQLTFPRPKQTVLMPGEFQRSTFDIYTEELEEWNDQRASSKRIHVNGWDFWGKQAESHGYVKVDIFLVKPHLLTSKESLFNNKELIKWIMEEVENGWWAKQNRKKTELEDWDPRKGRLFQYPQSEKEIHLFTNLSAYYFDVLEPGNTGCQAIRTYYYIPIENEYLLNIDFRSEIIGYEYFSSEHNFAEASANFIKDFMSKVTLELSDKAKAQKQAAENPLPLKHD